MKTNIDHLLSADLKKQETIASGKIIVQNIITGDDYVAEQNKKNGKWEIIHAVKCETCTKNQGQEKIQK